MIRFHCASLVKLTSYFDEKLIKKHPHIEPIHNSIQLDNKHPNKTKQTFVAKDSLEIINYAVDIPQITSSQKGKGQNEFSPNICPKCNEPRKESSRKLHFMSSKSASLKSIGIENCEKANTTTAHPHRNRMSFTSSGNDILDIYTCPSNRNARMPIQINVHFTISCPNAFINNRVFYF